MKRIIHRTIIGTIAGFLLGLAFLLATGQAHAVDRSTTERYAFDRMTPCPAGWKKPHVCEFHVRDHVIPLRCARDEDERKWLDSRYNMRWQNKEDALAKDAIEKYNCLHGFPAPH